MSILRDRRRLLLLLLLAVPMAVAVFAAVFIYYPAYVEVTYTHPLVQFELGSNAGKPDVAPGRVIEVELYSNKTEARVKIQPTYARTYYMDVLRIVTHDTRPLAIYLSVDSASGSGASNKELHLLVRQQGSPVALINVYPVRGGIHYIGILNPGAVFTLDILSEAVFNEGTEEDKVTIYLSVIYVTTTGEPPVPWPEFG